MASRPDIYKAAGRKAAQEEDASSKGWANRRTLSNLRAIASDATWGASDYLNAASLMMQNKGSRFNDALNFTRGMNEEARTRKGIISRKTGGWLPDMAVAGMILGAGGVGKAANIKNIGKIGVKPLVKELGKGAAKGAAAGALSGAINSYGTANKDKFSSNMYQAAKGAAVGGMMGTVVGAGAHGAVKAAKVTGRAVGDLVAANSTEFKKMSPQQLQRIMKRVIETAPPEVVANLNRARKTLGRDDVALASVLKPSEIAKYKKFANYSPNAANIGNTQITKEAEQHSARAQKALKETATDANLGGRGNGSTYYNAAKKVHKADLEKSRDQRMTDFMDSNENRKVDIYLPEKQGVRNVMTNAVGKDLGEFGGAYKKEVENVAKRNAERMANYEQAKQAGFSHIDPTHPYNNENTILGVGHEKVNQFSGTLRDVDHLRNTLSGLAENDPNAANAQYAKEAAAWVRNQGENSVNGYDQALKDYANKNIAVKGLDAGHRFVDLEAPVNAADVKNANDLNDPIAKAYAKIGGLQKIDETLGASPESAFNLGKTISNKTGIAHENDGFIPKYMGEDFNNALGERLGAENKNLDQIKKFAVSEDNIANLDLEHNPKGVASLIGLAATGATGATQGKFLGQLLSQNLSFMNDESVKHLARLMLDPKEVDNAISALNGHGLDASAIKGFAKEAIFREHPLSKHLDRMVNQASSNITNRFGDATFNTQGHDYTEGYNPPQENPASIDTSGVDPETANAIMNEDAPVSSQGQSSAPVNQQGGATQEAPAQEATMQNPAGNNGMVNIGGRDIPEDVIKQLEESGQLN